MGELLQVKSQTVKFQAGECSKYAILYWVKSGEDKSLHMQPYHKTKYTWKGRKG